MTNHKRKKVLLLLCGVCVVCSALVVACFHYSASDELEVTFFDVGQGDSIFIETPSGQQILIDGGPDDSVLNKLGRAMPFYDHSIDCVVLTHPHSDHVAGLIDVARRYDVGMALYTGVASESPDFIEWRSLIDEKNIPLTIAHAGQIFKYGETRLEVLYPFEDISSGTFKDFNGSSVVIRLTYRDASFLFTGDAPVDIEEKLLERNGSAAGSLQSDVLKVGHHGSKYSSSLEFLQAVSPQYAVIQVGEGNTFGHPHRITLTRLEGLGVSVYRNDEAGDIEMRSDGERAWVE